jgi:hypothetical protein
MRFVIDICPVAGELIIFGEDKSKTYWIASIIKSKEFSSIWQDLYLERQLIHTEVTMQKINQRWNLHLNA